MGKQNFADHLIGQMREKKSRVVVGLDPDWEHLPENIKETAQAQFSMQAEGMGSHMWAIREFCEEIISTTQDVAVAYKPQMAFFEQYGYTGLRVLERILKDHEDKIFILDCKRSDIGNTSKAYAKAYFNHADDKRAPMPCDALTHNPLLGLDSIEPYFEYLADGKGMFLLAKTSNPSAADFQDLEVNGKPLYEIIAEKTEEWGQAFIGEEGYSALGLVVGATQVEAAQRIRNAAPHSIILVPGMQTQGGKLDDAKAFCDDQGMGAVFNFSRSISYAYKFGPFSEEHTDEQYKEAARIAAEHYRVSLNEILGDPS